MANVIMHDFHIKDEAIGVTLNEEITVILMWLFQQGWNVADLYTPL